MSALEFASAFPQESDVVERKTGISEKAIQDAVVAFSNTRGGVVLIGVDDHGDVVGRDLNQKAVESLNQAILSARNAGRYQIHELAVADKPVVVLAVERRIEGFAQTQSGRILVRVGPRNIALFDSDLVRFLSERSLRRFELEDSDVPFEQAEAGLVDEIAAAFAWGDPAAYRDRLMERRLLLENGNLTIAGALFLTRKPSEHVGKAYVEILRYPAQTGDYDRRLTIDGPVHAQVEMATRLIMDELGSELVVLGVQRHELPRLPAVVLREAVANALAHRSYEMNGSSVRAEIRPDAVKITSPGPLPVPVTVENMRDAQAARNIVVIGVLRRLRLAEDAGRGVDVMQDSMRAELLDPPVFEDTGHSVDVTLPVRGPVTAEERAWVREQERRGRIEPGDRLLLVHAARGEVLTNAKARSIACVDRVEAMRALRRLREAGFLVQQGERGGATYALEGSLRAPAGLRLTSSELKEVVVRMTDEGPVTNAAVRERTGLVRAEALRLLDSLVAEGRLARVGERRGTRYLKAT